MVRPRDDERDSAKRREFCKFRRLRQHQFAALNFDGRTTHCASLIRQRLDEKRVSRISNIQHSISNVQVSGAKFWHPLAACSLCGTLGNWTLGVGYWIFHSIPVTSQPRCDCFALRRRPQAVQPQSQHPFFATFPKRCRPDRGDGGRTASGQIDPAATFAD